MAMLLFCGVLFVGPATSTGAAQVEDQGPPEGPYTNEHVLVKLAPGWSASSVVGNESRPVFARWIQVPVPAGQTPENKVRMLADHPGVEAATLDHIVQLEPSATEALDAPGASATPNDPYYRFQWHFPPIKVEEAWNESTGSGSLVAVIDSGVSRDGEDLDCHNFVSPYNAITNTAGAVAAEDDHGHGTHVAGTVAQCTNNGIGVAGIAFKASLMPVKVLDEDGSGTSSSVARGVDWARSRGADVMNLSLGFGCGTTTWPGCSSRIINDALEAAAAEDIVIVAASGNSGDEVVSHPANHPDVIAVGAVDYKRAVTGYSNRGEALDLVAPGGDLSQDANGDGYGDGVLQETAFANNWNYYFLQGTSMASPHVAGAAAILRALAPDADRHRIGDALAATALDLGPPACDSSYGHGLIQIHDALEYLTGPDTISPVFPKGASLKVSELTKDKATLRWTPACDDLTRTRYQIYHDGQPVKSVGADVTHATIDGLDPATANILAVRAVDAAGNRSSALTAKVTTSDTRTPVWPDGSELNVLGYGETQLTLGWPVASDDQGVTGYVIRPVGGTGLATGGNQATISGLESGSPYTFEVLARDVDGNWSDPLTISTRTAVAFVDTPGTVFYDDILWLSGNDITRGCNPPEGDRYCPADPVTRGQMAAFLNRAFRFDPSSKNSFSDDDDSVFEADIEALAASGVTHGCNPPTNDLFCPDDPVTRGQMAAFLTRALSFETSAGDPFADDDESVFEADIEALAASGVTHGCNPPTNDLFCPYDPVTRGQMAAFLNRALREDR